MMMQENRELKQKFDKIQSSAEGLAQDLRAMGETAKATGRASLTAGGKTLYPQNYGLKIASLLSQVEKLDKDLRNVSGQSGGELLNNLTELSSVLRTTSNSFVGIAGLSENLDQTLRGFDIATKAAASATIAYTERIRRRGGIAYGPSTQRLLPPSSALSLREIGETMAQRYQAPSRGIKGLLPAGGKTPGEAITEAYIAELRRSFSSRNAIAGLLPPAVEPSPGAYRTVRPEPAPPVVETRAELFARRTREAYINSAARAADERQSPLALSPARERGLGQPPFMTAPSIGESRARPMGMTGAAPQRGPSGGGPEGIAFVDASRNALAYDKALTGLRESIKGVQVAQLPLVGGIKGLAGEFGQATKQVLLYGTAYKGLAFLTSLPGKAFNAAKALGTYKNQLQAVTSETGTFSNSLAFVDNLAQRFNVPLESARQGFVKLYASMQPTGFSQGQIEGLFTGISQASAAFGLSADKVDRVNYAFAQMASKGQIMSEELKGQLGDVLPGALSLFAEAAKMSIPEFSKAMEDGAFKGDAMIQVLENVGILMKVKFGAAAEGAAKTLQGALNGIQNNLKLMYEALGPVVDRMAAVFGPQVTSLIKNVTDVIKAFELGISTTGDSFAAMSPQAQGFYSSIQSILPSIKALVPSFIAAGQNIGYFASSLATASQPLLGLLKLTLDFISIPFVARVAVYATIIGTLTSAFTLLKNTGIIQATIAMIRFIATLTVAQVQAWISSIQSAIAALVTMARTANIAKLSLMALKVTLISFGVGAVLLGLDFVVQRLLNIGSAADDAKKRTAALTDELARAVETGNVALTSGKYVEKETEAQSLGKNKQILERFQGGFQQGASMTKQEYQQLQRAGLATGINFNERKGRATATSGQVAENLKTAQAGYVEALNAAGSAQEALADSIQVQGNMKRELEASRSQMKDIPPATGADGDAGATKIKDKQKYVSDMAKLLQQEMQQKINAINQDASISDREREIQAAATRYDYELLINKAEHSAGINDENKKDILNRGQYLADLQKTLKAENELSRQRYENVVTSPLRDMLSEDKKAIIELEAAEKMISEGRTERTYVETREIQIKQALVGLDEKQIQVLQPLIDLILKAAAARDKLTEANKRNLAFTGVIKTLQEEIKLLLIINDEERRIAELRKTYSASESQEIFNLEKIKKNIEETRALISDFVSSTASDYKGFLKAVISGEDAVDALKQFQAGLTDKVLTIFLDFTMAPVEKFFKESLGNLFLPKAENIPGLDVAKEVTKDPVQATNSNTNATVANTAALKEVAGVLTGTSLSPSTSELGSTLSTNVTGTIENVTEQTKAEGIKFSESLGKTVGAIGIAAGSIMGIAAGIGQIKEGGTSNVLGGIGSVLMSLGGAVGGFAGFFKGANGGIAGGGWKPFPVTAFANGGMVNGPTLGLVGEGKYNEAIVPLPDGRSIPVQMKGGGGGLREAMNGNTGRASNSPILNMSFQSTNINGVEYVSRDQLEQAMVATRRQAASDGAKRGMSMTLDKLQQSPSTRSRLGMGGR